MASLPPSNPEEQSLINEADLSLEQILDMLQSAGYSAETQIPDAIWLKHAKPVVVKKIDEIIESHDPQPDPNHPAAHKTRRKRR